MYTGMHVRMLRYLREEGKVGGREERCVRKGWERERNCLRIGGWEGQSACMYVHPYMQVLSMALLTVWNPYVTYQR